MNIDKGNLFDSLCKLGGVYPHHGGSNPVAHDGIFARSLERKYGKSIAELQRLVNFSAYTIIVEATQKMAHELHLENIVGDKT